MKRTTIKREVDFQVLSDWVEPKSRVLDLGCGRGLLLEHLINAKQAYAVGVDTDTGKVASCVKRGVPIYQGNIASILTEFPDHFFDWVICSRTLPELENPETILEESLRVGKRLAVGFVNHGFWTNRLSFLTRGARVQNEVYPKPWYCSRPNNPVNIGEFEAFCQKKGITVNRREFLDGSWMKPCSFLPDLFAGYAIYDLKK